MTTVLLLTPPGTGAIAVLEVHGPDAWRIASTLFQPATGTLPETPARRKRWFGTLAGDDVILAVTGQDRIEVHCHGGRAVVTLIQNQFLNAGCVPAPPPHPNDPWALLPLAKTLRTASILLDQCDGAFENAIRNILKTDYLQALIDELVNYGPIGQHLFSPWKIAIVGAPNVGKSSLMNALAGYERSLVSAIPGTTRDAVSVTLAFDGWPVELIDTAGLRKTESELEAEGIRLSHLALATADLVIAVMDGSAGARSVSEGSEVHPSLTLPALEIRIANKADHADFVAMPQTLAVSAKTGEGLPELIAATVQAIVPVVPPPGAAIPYTPDLVAKVRAAHTHSLTGNFTEAREILTACLVGPP